MPSRSASISVGIGEDGVDLGSADEAHQAASRVGGSAAVAVALTGPHRFELEALGFRLRPARRAPPAALADPGRDPAEKNAEEERRKDQDEERQGEGQGRVGPVEGIERDRRRFAVGDREDDDQHRERHEDEEEDEPPHGRTSLL